MTVSIDVLPDDALLEIFAFFLVGELPFPSNQTERWRTPVHVCGRWRRVIFASPCRLDLQIHCTARTRVKEMLHIWPVLPIKIWNPDATWEGEGSNNIIAALQHNDRVCQIELDNLSSLVLERIAAVSQEPFPAPTHLRLSASVTETTAPVFPEVFLGGSAPRLRSCEVWGVAILRIWKLLSSANHLVDLFLWDIPHSGYISPEAMVTVLSATANLVALLMAFRSPLSRPNPASRQPLPVTRIVAPALTDFSFKGVSEYIEDLLSQIETPLLGDFEVELFNQLIFDTPLLHDFFARTDMFKARNRATVMFSRDIIQFKLESGLSLRISCTYSDWQISSMAQVCTSSLPLFSTLERLDISEDFFPPHWQDDVENGEWLELLRPFTALKDLYLVKNLGPLVTAALQELAGESVMEALPALRNLYIEGLRPLGPIREAVGQLVTAQRLSGHPVAVRRWDGRS